MVTEMRCREGWVEGEERREMSKVERAEVEWVYL